MARSREQISILAWAAAAILMTVVITICAWLWLPPTWVGIDDEPSIAERLAYALRVDMPIFLWLAGCVRVVASIRYRSNADRAGSAYAPPSPRLRAPAAVLQNSLEQTVLAVGGHLALATTLRGGELVLLPTLTGLYLLGRITFAFAYPRGAAARAFGMALTGASTMAAYALAIVQMVAGR